MKTQTLIDKTEAMTRKICALIDANAPSADIAKARAERDALKATVRATPNGRNYDTGLYA